ncbi:MAG TPA: PEP/pyruvate-binding domain-containing protein, partial [Candidatus Bathyarchaeia archaeon]|nr:PEP/pyruvate-binding domain-containing protein [Candidatus Bathyarchaeia archaeon]
FIYKRSHGMLWDLRKWLLESVGFGDFIFKLPSGETVGIARDIISFYKEINRVPIESLIYHGKNDHFSNWLSARGEFEIAQKLKPRQVSEFDHEELRNFLLITINEVVLEKTRGIISDFSRDNYHPETLFLRLRPGSLGGKGRGLAFLMFLLNSFLIQDEFKMIDIEIPKTMVIGTAEFDSFMEVNNLYDLAYSGFKDEEIRDKFVKAKLSKSLVNDLEFILKDLKNPLAIRSSSLLEDSAYQPFAGIFSTYMIPNNSKNAKENLEQLCTAIKLVFASPFLQVASSYAETIGQTVEESKMAVVIQEVVGKEHHERYYPDFSGTAASYNYYPFGEYMVPEDRIAHLALGLGRIIVDGGASVRFCPKYPKINFHATPDKLLDSSQKNFYAIDLSKRDFDVLKDDPFVQKYGLDVAIEDKTLSQVADTFHFTDNSLQIGYHGNGSPVITFNKQLQLETMPLANLISKILIIGEKAMGCSIEIEFAGNFGNSSKEISKFYLLQIRPFLQQESMLSEENMESYEVKQLLAYSNQVSGNLFRKDISDIVYIKPETFDKTKTLAMVQEINKINAQLMTENRKYLLFGFGRWGTSDRFLGIPVNWHNISNAKTIVEAGLEDFQIDFSQGSHFFHNIVTSNIGYLHIKYNLANHFIDWKWLKEQPVITDLEFVRHIRTNKPITIRIDAKNREGMIIKPKEK